MKKKRRGRGMGAKLLKAFEIAKESGGLQAEMRLAMKSGMSRQKAEKEADAPDKISKVEKALGDIIGKTVKI